MAATSSLSEAVGADANAPGTMAVAGVSKRLGFTAARSHRVRSYPQLLNWGFHIWCEALWDGDSIDSGDPEEAESEHREHHIDYYCVGRALVKAEEVRLLGILKRNFVC